MKVCSTLSITLTVLLKLRLFPATCFSNFSTVSKVLNRGSEQNIIYINFDLLFFLELSDVSIVVILLLLAHLNSLTLLRPDENEAFEYGIITPATTLKYRQNLIPFSQLMILT